MAYAGSSIIIIIAAANCSLSTTLAAAAAAVRKLMSVQCLTRDISMDLWQRVIPVSEFGWDTTRHCLGKSIYYHFQTLGNGITVIWHASCRERRNNWSLCHWLNDREERGNGSRVLRWWWWWWVMRLRVSGQR